MEMEMEMIKMEIKMIKMEIKMVKMEIKMIKMEIKMIRKKAIRKQIAIQIKKVKNTREGTILEGQKKKRRK